MAKKLSPLDIMNTMGDAADKKAKKAAPSDNDADDMPAPKKPLAKVKAPKPPFKK